MDLHGGCACGNITFELDWDPAPLEIPARACGCSFCVKHCGVWTSNPNGALRVAVKAPSLVSKYAFETGTAHFLVCSRCGVVPVVVSEIDGRLYAVVNVNTFVDVDPALLRRVPASFDGETTDSRLARRQRNWIGNVTMG
ncbi:MAG: GFA family protein [Rhizobacter sp.]